MSRIIDWEHEYLEDQQFFRDLTLSWFSFLSKQVKCEIPDLVRMTGLLKSVGFNVVKVEKMEGESWVPGVTTGCTVEIQCPVSKTKITLSSNEAVCYCQRNIESPWSLSYAGATTGQSNLKRSEMQIAMPPELTPDKERIIRNCLTCLINFVWCKNEGKPFSPNPYDERLVKSLECLIDKTTEINRVVEHSRSLQCIEFGGDTGSIVTSANTSSHNSLLESSGAESNGSTPRSIGSCGKANNREKNKVTQRLSLPATKLNSKQPPPNSPYWESSTVRAKRYVEMVRQRDAEKRKPK